MECPFTAELVVTKQFTDDKGFHVVGYAATKDHDLQGDVISPEAMKHSEKDLLKNSTALFNHNHDLPIGRVVKQTLNKKGILVDILLNEDATIPELGMKIVDAVKQGILNKFSISAKVIDQAREFVQSVGRTVNVIKRMLLLEVSLVSVPANPEAKALEWYVKKGLREAEAAELEKQANVADELQKEQVVNKPEHGLTHLSIVADSEPDWADVDKTELPEVAFVREAPDHDPDLKSTWAFPHHFVPDGGDLDDQGIITSGNLFLHRGGLNAAFAAAQGARSGERAAPEVIAHLQEHREDIGIDEESSADVETNDKEKTESEESMKKESTDKTDKDVQPDKTKGVGLGNLMSDLIDGLVTDDKGRGDIMEEIGDAAGISGSTVGQIVSGDIVCPPLDRLEGLARGLGVSMARLVSAAEGDGCEYNSESSADESDTEKSKSDETVNKTEQKGSTPTMKSFPLPEDLNAQWSKHCQDKGLTMATKQTEVVEAWHSFCKDEGFPAGFPFPYPSDVMPDALRIAEIAEDMLKNSDDTVVAMGSDLKDIVSYMLAELIPQPDLAAAKALIDAESKSEDDSEEEEATEKKDTEEKTEKTEKEEKVQKSVRPAKRKAIVDSVKQKSEAPDEFKKQLEGMSPTERLRAILEIEESRAGS